ncbi:hypothetical protein CDAR_45571 [Caerostris darwini]|uniref:Uncharacterized protein n=1 Tax=Caerostris darwini TaxID=1538125 RepID=A0AAV4N6N9_9ARAC|nr:hypothetical protein CDAR_45571 [Caerostris darwini]
MSRVKPLIPYLCFLFQIIFYVYAAHGVEVKAAPQIPMLGGMSMPGLMNGLGLNMNANGRAGFGFGNGGAPGLNFGFGGNAGLTAGNGAGPGLNFGFGANAGLGDGNGEVLDLILGTEEMQVLILDDKIY